YTMEDLLERIQASEEELKTHMETIHACQIEGYWRVLDFDYEMKLLGHVTQLVDSESWSFNKVSLQTSLEELGPLEPREMIEHCLNCYGKRYTENGKVFYALHEDKVCWGLALMLLQNVVKFNLKEFQYVWQQSVPEGMSTRLDQLKGVALVDRTSHPETISLLRVEDLPEDTVERFNHLFSLREKWTEDDITPYIQDLCGEKQTTGALLTKYARSSVQNGIKVFNSRRPVAT
ncbi:Sister chromatid cohesion protein DCC1, partial [Goodea atripinnis]